MGKLLGWIILFKEKAALYTSDQQFGFKHGLSTILSVLTYCKKPLVIITLETIIIILVQ